MCSAIVISNPTSHCFLTYSKNILEIPGFSPTNRDDAHETGTCAFISTISFEGMHTWFVVDKIFGPNEGVHHLWSDILNN